MNLRPYNEDDYATAEWKQLRDQVIERAEGICEVCGEEKAYTAHHLTYIFGVLCPPKWLKAICRGCHEELHGKTPWWEEMKREDEALEMVRKALNILRSDAVAHTHRVTLSIIDPIHPTVPYGLDIKVIPKPSVTPAAR